MSEENLRAILSDDPLGGLARKERKALLATSLLALAMSKAGLIPTEIAFFGIKTSTIRPSAILGLIAATITYFLFSFLMHAGTDFMAWWVRYKKWLFEADRERQQQEDEYGPGWDEPSQDDPSNLKSWTVYHASHRVLQQAVFAKAFFLDLIIPYLIGCTALFYTVTAALD